MILLFGDVFSNIEAVGYDNTMCIYRNIQPGECQLISGNLGIY